MDHPLPEGPAPGTWEPPARFDEFRLLRPLGRGTMGQVFLGHDTQLDRPVAIKFLAVLDPGAAARERFLTEARAIARLSHPNVVAIYRVGEVAGRPYLVSEFVRGTSLERLERPVPWQRALGLGLDLARGLGAAHQQGVIHRDIKPANVLLTESCQVKLLDFGLAKLLAALPAAEPAPAGAPGPEVEATLSFHGGLRAPPEPAASPALTVEGELLGTPLYMAPELWRGEPATRASDVYSLGALLYELCAGHAPQEGGTLRELRDAVTSRDAAPLAQAVPGVDARFAAVVDRCLKRAPAARFASAEELGRELEALTGPGPAPAPRTARRRFVPALLLVLAALAGAGVLMLRGRGPAPPIDSLAVLPFENAGGDPETEYLSDGITEGLLNRVAQLSQLKVIARASAFRYKGKAVDPLLAGRELGVRAVLTGRVSQRGDGLSISAELMGVADNRQLWGGRYERRLADAQAVQDEIVGAVAGRLRLRGEDRGRLGRPHTASPEAYQLYLRGRHFEKRAADPELHRALGYFQQAVDRDPGYALAHAGLAGAYVNLAWTTELPMEVIPRARAEAQRALELDDGLGEAHVVLGRIAQAYDWDFARAEKEYRRALALGPNDADAHHQYSHYLLDMGRSDESLAETLRALELDPLDMAMSGHLGFHYLKTGQYERAIAEYRKAIELDPERPNLHTFLAEAYIGQGQYPEALAEARRSLARYPHELVAQICVARIHALAGRRQEALRDLGLIEKAAEERHVSSVRLAWLQVALGNREAALDRLERAYRERDPQLTGLKIEPALASLRGDPRFQDLLHRIGLMP